MSQGEKDRRIALRALRAIGWKPVTDPPTQNAKGYINLRCSCGQHQCWLHKTPSNPRYFAEKVAWAARTCTIQSDA